MMAARGRLTNVDVDHMRVSTATTSDKSTLSEFALHVGVSGSLERRGKCKLVKQVRRASYPGHALVKSHMAFGASGGFRGMLATIIHLAQRV